MSAKLPGWRVTLAASPMPAPRPPAPGVPSPCINVCRMDAASGLCEGCFRTLDEIGAWSLFDDAEKLAVWQTIAERRGAAGAPAVALPLQGAGG